MLVGILYIVGTAAGVLSLIFTGSLRADDYLTAIAANPTRVKVGVLFVLTMGLALTFIPVLLHPIFKRHNERLSMSYIIFRSGLESVSYILSSVVMLLLVSLSALYVKNGSGDTAMFDVLGGLLHGADGWINNMRVLVFGISALIINAIFYQTRLIPRWISAWGFIAAALHIANGFLDMFGLLDTMSLVGSLLDVPTGLQELVMAVWLIVKGFAQEPLSRLLENE